MSLDTSSAHSIASSLPFEILQEIFSDGALLSTQQAYTLCFVSSWVKDVAMPFLYRTIRITYKNAQSFVQLHEQYHGNQESQPPSSTRSPFSHVRNLSCISWLDPEFLHRVLSGPDHEDEVQFIQRLQGDLVKSIVRCTNLENLLLVDNITSLMCHPSACLPGKMSLRVFGEGSPARSTMLLLDDRNSSDHVFLCLTHLHISWSLHSLRYGKALLARFPSLRSLTITACGDVMFEDVERLVESCEKLEALDNIIIVAREQTLFDNNDRAPAFIMRTRRSRQPNVYFAPVTSISSLQQKNLRSMVDRRIFGYLDLCSAHAMISEFEMDILEGRSDRLLTKAKFYTKGFIDDRTPRTRV